MEWWCKDLAVKAFLQTISLCKADHEKRCCSFWNPGLQKSELLSALAAGTNSQLIIEICGGVTCTTIALAAASRQTGGRFICVLSTPEILPHSLHRMKAIGLLEDVQFFVGNPEQLVSQFTNIDFAVIEYRNDKFQGLFETLNLNPKGAMVSAKDLFNKQKGIVFARDGFMTKTQQIGNGLEVTRIVSKDETLQRLHRDDNNNNKRGHVKFLRLEKRWIVYIDIRSGEEHAFRIRPRKYNTFTNK